MKKINIKNKIKKVKKKTGRKKKKSTAKKFNLKLYILGSILVLGIIGITALLILGLYIIITAPDFETDLLYQQQATVIFDINGDELIRTGESNITLVTYDQLPEVLIDAIVATEDSRFFQHSGFDAPRFLVATLNQLVGNSDAGGASTLSMQVIKNTYTSNDAEGITGILRKLTDIYMSIFKLENTCTKDEIIEFYVNSQWFGNDNDTNYTGIKGVEEGSQYLFDKSVSNLTLAESSLLAGMFQSPYSYNPYKFPEAARKRQTTVLKLMVRHGYISQKEMDAALLIPIESLLSSQEQSETNYLQAPIDYVLNEVYELTEQHYDAGLHAYDAPMEVYTTIDPEIQKVLHDLETGKSYTIPESAGDLQFGIAVTNVDNGSITALSGGRNYIAKGNNRSIIRRQPGSTAKPLFDYGPYIEYLNGSPGTYFIDDKYTYTDGTKMNNWDRSYFGIIPMRRALVTSRNIPALQAFHEVSKKDKKLIENFVHNLGIDYGKNLYESASIGGFDGISPLELSAAYATFARGGYYIEPYSITKIVMLENDEVIEHKYSPNKVMSEETAYMITDMLVTAGNDYVGGFKISETDLAAKTGTTNIDEDDKKELGLPADTVMDIWTATFSPEYSMAVWQGYDSLSPEYYMTIKNAYPIKTAMNSAIGKKIYSTNKKFKVPDGIVTVKIEKDTFPLQLASENTPSNMIVEEIFKEGTEPTGISTRYETLNNVTNVVGESKSNTATITWKQIETPDAINETKLINYFNKYFKNNAVKYYEQRVAYNNKYIGSLMYDVYIVKDGTEKLLGSSSSNTFSFDYTNYTDYDEIIVKSSYSVFSASDSSGTKIKIDFFKNFNPLPGLGEEPDPDDDKPAVDNNDDDLE